MIKIKWTYEYSNPMSSIIKTMLLLTLKFFININCINISNTKLIKQASIKQANINIKQFMKILLILLNK